MFHIFRKLLEEGLRPANFWDVTVSNVLYAWQLLGRRPLRVVVDA
ncbi:unnamed protein product, partial [marine sediment metagenome]